MRMITDDQTEVVACLPLSSTYGVGAVERIETTPRSSSVGQEGIEVKADRAAVYALDAVSRLPVQCVQIVRARFDLTQLRAGVL
jgi:hypothetical protein